MPEISVIVPVYNAAAFLEECVASVVAQTYTYWELLLVDDGSTDGSAELCRALAGRYAGRDIRTLRCRGKGVSDARNTGLAEAKGRYVVFLDADDAYEPDAFATMVRVAGTADADIVVVQFVEGLRMLPLVRYSPGAAVEATLYQRPGMHESAWGKLYRRSLFDSPTPFASQRRYEDLEAFAPIYMRAKAIAVCRDRLYRYRHNPGSFLNNWTDDRLDALWAVNSISRRYGERFEGATRSRRFSAYFNIFNLALANGRPDIARRCWEEIEQMRRAVALDPKARRRNRLAAVASYLGFGFTSFLSKISTK